MENVLKIILEELQKHRKKQEQLQRFQRCSPHLDDTLPAFTFPSCSSVDKESSCESVAKDAGVDLPGSCLSSHSEERLEVASLSTQSTDHRPLSNSICSFGDVGTSKCDMTWCMKSQSTNNVGQDSSLDVGSLVDSGVDMEQSGSSSLVSPVDPNEDLFSSLEPSSLVPFLERQLLVDSFLEICQHASVSYKF